MHQQPQKHCTYPQTGTLELHLLVYRRQAAKQDKSQSQRNDAFNFTEQV